MTLAPGASSGGADGGGARSLQLRRIGANLSGVVGINLLALVTGPILAQELGPSDRGVLAAVLSWPALIAALLGIGVQDAVTYFASRGDAGPRNVMRASGRLAALQGLAIWLLGLPVVYVVFEDLGDGALANGLMYLAVMPVLVTFRYMTFLLNGLHRYRAYNALLLSQYALNAAVVVALWSAAELTVRTAVLAAVGSLLVATAAAALVVARVLRPERLVPADGLTRRLIDFGLRSHLSAFPHILNERVDVLAMSVALSTRQLGLYVVAVTVATVPTFAGLAVSTAVLPTVASMHSVPEQAATARRAVVLTVGLTLPVSVLFALAMHPLIGTVFGDPFLPAVPAARVLVFGAVMISVARVYHALLKGLGRPLDAAVCEGCALIITGIGLAALLGPLGISGAAVTSLLAYSTSVVVGAVLAGRAMGVRPSALLVPRRNVTAPGAHHHGG